MSCCRPLKHSCNCPLTCGPLALGHLVQRLLFDFLAAPLATEHRLSETVAQACHWIDERLTVQLPVPVLAKRLGISASTLTRRFKEEVGTTPADYHLRRRIDRAGQLLRSGKSVTETAIEMGFCSSQHFATQYRKVTHHSPIVANAKKSLGWTESLPGSIAFYAVRSPPEGLPRSHKGKGERCELADELPPGLGSIVSRP